MRLHYFSANPAGAGCHIGYNLGTVEGRTTPDPSQVTCKHCLERLARYTKAVITPATVEVDLNDLAGTMERFGKLGASTLEAQASPYVQRLLVKLTP